MNNLKLDVALYGQFHNLAPRFSQVKPFKVCYLNLKVPELLKRVCCDMNDRIVVQVESH